MVYGINRADAAGKFKSANWVEKKAKISTPEDSTVELYRSNKARTGFLADYFPRIFIVSVYG